jgi:hypothetical protein
MDANDTIHVVEKRTSASQRRGCVALDYVVRRDTAWTLSFATQRRFALQSPPLRLDFVLAVQMQRPAVRITESNANADVDILAKDMDKDGAEN